jgi:hypothetical protein
MEASMTEKKSLAMCSEIKSNWEGERYREVYIFEEKREKRSTEDGARWVSGD